MILCKHCGVELEDAAPFCPLCRHPLESRPGTAQTRAAEGIRDFAPPVLAHSNTKRHLRSWVLELLSLLAVTGVIIVLVADLAFSGSLTWSRYPLIAIATVMVAAGAFLVGLELLLHSYLDQRWFISWSAVAVACMLPPLLLMLYLRGWFLARQLELRKLLHM